VLSRKFRPTIVEPLWPEWRWEHILKVEQNRTDKIFEPHENGKDVCVVGEVREIRPEYCGLPRLATRGMSCAE
jgi:hypothetical protein